MEKQNDLPVVSGNFDNHASWQHKLTALMQKLFDIKYAATYLFTAAFVLIVAGVGIYLTADRHHTLVPGSAAGSNNAGTDQQASAGSPKSGANAPAQQAKGQNSAAAGQSSSAGSKASSATSPSSSSSGSSGTSGSSSGSSGGGSTGQSQTSAAIPLGVYIGTHSPSDAAGFDAWLGGGRLKYTLEFLDATSWSTISDPSWFLSQWSGNPYTMVWGVPMLPCGSSSTQCSTNASVFDAVAAGSDNGYFKTLAQNLVAGGQGSSFIRIGWEFNGSWFPWNVCNSDGQADFVNAFRNIVNSMRSVSGQSFKFIWNPDEGSTGCAAQIEDYYPGDSYVDVVSLDAYDTVWDQSDAQARWQELLDGTTATNWAPTTPNSIGGQSFAGYGLNWLAAFGAEHGKLVGLPEWGLWNDGSQGSSGDDTYYIDQMAAWISAHANGPAVYWDYGSSSLDVPGVSSGNNPNASTEFAKDF